MSTLALDPRRLGATLWLAAWLCLPASLTWAQPSMPAADSEADAEEASAVDEGAAETAVGPNTVPCCYVPVAIHVDGFGRDNSTQAKPLGASLYINGRLVGETPFVDALPASTYRFELELSGEVLLNEVRTLEPGVPYTVRKRVSLPPSPEELAELKAQKQAARRAREERAVAQRAEFDKAYAEWKRETAPLRRRRERLTHAARVTGAIAVGLTVVGTGTLLGARRTNKSAQEDYDRWLAATVPATRAGLADLVTEAEQRRDRLWRAGWSLLGMGLASVLPSALTAVRRPDVPQAPRLVDFLQVAPQAYLRGGGLRLKGAF